MREPTRFELWAWSPVIIFRVALISVYLICIYCGVMSVIAGVPVFDMTAPAGWHTLWGALLCLAAIVSAVSAIDDKWQVVERWASMLLSGLLLAYAGSLNYVAYVSGDLDRMFVGGVAVGLLVVPACRFGWLASRAGTRKVTQKAADE